MSLLKRNLRTLIVDNEAPARESIRERLRELPGFEVVGESANALAAIRDVLALRPNVVFLDIQLPRLDGFNVLEAVARQHAPLVVFVTAWEELAVRAFEAHAIDYLLKPFSRERFLQAAERVRSAALNSALLAAHHRATATLLDSRAGASPRESRLALRDARGFRFVFLSDIEWIESADNYVRIHAHGGNYLERQTLNELEATLDPERFLRVHRRFLVNVQHVDRVLPGSNGGCAVRMKDGTMLRMSRYRRPVLLSRLADIGTPPAQQEESA